MMLLYIRQVLETHPHRKLEVFNVKKPDGSLSLIATMQDTETETELFRAYGFGDVDSTLLALDIICAQLRHKEDSV